MNRFIALIPRYLIKNKKRNFFVALSIVISVVLLVGVKVTVNSLDYRYKINALNSGSGNYHASMLMDLEGDSLKNDNLIETSGQYAKLGTETFKEQKFILEVAGVETETLKLLRMNVLEGNYPKEKGEIVVEKSVKDKLFPNNKIGDYLTINFQKQLQDTDKGTLIGIKAHSIKCKLVGIVSNSSNSGNISNGKAIVTMDEAKTIENILVATNYFRVKNEKNVESDLETVDNYYRMKNTSNRLQRNEPYLNALKLEFATEKLGMFLMIIVSIAAIAVVYNIFYITTLERIKEFSMLRAIGSSRGKINELILGEAFLISIVCIPLGLLIGCFGIKALFYFCISKDSYMLKELITKKDIIQVAIMVVISIFVSAFSPSRAMGKISSIEGIKESYINSQKGKRNKLNSMKPRNVFKFLKFTESMAYLNTKKSKKRLIVTVLSLTISIVITASSLYLLSMFNPQKEAEKSTGGDILLDLKDSRGLIKDYAYNDDDIKKIQVIDGIKNIRKHKKIDMTITESKTFLTERGKKFLESISTSSKEEDKNQMPVTIYGVDDSEIESFKPYLKEGSLQLDNFSDKPTVIAVQNLHYKEYTNLSVGDNLVVSGTYRDNADGNFQSFKKANFNVAAILESTPIRPIDGQTSIILICSNKTLEKYFEIREYEMVNIDVTSKATIYEISRNLSSIVKSKNSGNITTITDEINKMSQGNVVIRAVLLGFSMLLVVVAVINILNTMSISVVMRKREIGVLRAVGMSQAEVRKMIIKEGSLYGILSAILGSLLSLGGSYVIYNTMKVDFLENEPFKIPWLIISSIVILDIIITTLISLPAANRAIDNSIVESIKAIE